MINNETCSKSNEGTLCQNDLSVIKASFSESNNLPDFAAEKTKRNEPKARDFF